MSIEIVMAGILILIVAVYFLGMFLFPELLGISKNTDENDKKDSRPE